jgi:HME family heavy-metal exporter
VENLPSVEVEVEQPIAHLISHMLSGVTAQIAIKIVGDDLDTLRRSAEQVRAAIADIPGLAPPMVEQQQLIPQLRIELDYQRLAEYGLSAGYVNDMVETALSGKVVSEILEGQRRFDLVVRFPDEARANIGELDRLPIELPDGGRIPLRAVARLQMGAGPSTIHREDGQRRIVVRVNTLGRDVGSAVSDIRRTVNERVSLPEGYAVMYGGQFEAQQTATRRIALLSGVALMVIFLVLYSAYPSTRIVLQILIALPAAFVGGVVALWLTNQSFSVASLVGFISLGGIAARNGLLLISTYLGLIPEKGFHSATVLEGSLERLAPVLMTALTTGIGLVPIVIGGHLPGKELLFPIATVMLGGLTSSTLCEYTIRPGLFLWLSGKDAVQLARDIEINEEMESAAAAPVFV